MKEKVVLGIDTSNYTTSYAIIGLDGNLVANLKRPLSVKSGERGLRQSDAVFLHIKNLSELAQEARIYLKNKEIVSIGVSSKPRNIEGSYMPCFLSGLAVAENLSSALGIELHKFSHQCGHIMAAIYSSGREDFLSDDFAAFHISGGTTELIRVRSFGDGFNTELLGGTIDLNAGQIIDRIGVHIGLPFPSGKYIEELALSNISEIPKRKPTVKDLSVNFSGVENMALNLFEKTGNKALVSAFVLKYISDAISLLCESYIQKYGKSSFLFAGGVMCNSIIKREIKSKFDAVFAEPEFSSDNAVGISALALRKYNQNN